MNDKLSKHTLRSKIIYLVVGVIILSFAVFFGLCVYQDTRDVFASPVKIAADSPLVVLARVDTNAPAQSWVVTEIWRQPKDISSSSIKVGAKLPFTPPVDKSALPDGVIVCYRRSLPLIETGRFRSQAEFYIRGGRIENYSIAEFKKACGL